MSGNFVLSSQYEPCKFLASGGFKFYFFFKNACMVYKHAVVAAFHIYAQLGEVAAKRGGWSLCIK